MSEHKKNREKSGQQRTPKRTVLEGLVFVAIVVGILLGFKFFSGRSQSSGSRPTSAASTNEAASSGSVPSSITASTNSAAGKTNISQNTNVPVLQKAPEIPTMEINTAVMVTVELDF